MDTIEVGERFSTENDGAVSTKSIYIYTQSYKESEQNGQLNHDLLEPSSRE